MLEMKQATKFKKDLKRLEKRNANLEKLKTVMQMIVEKMPLPEEEYRAHLLEPTKDYLDCWECHISGRNSDWLFRPEILPFSKACLFYPNGDVFGYFFNFYIRSKKGNSRFILTAVSLFV